MKNSIPNVIWMFIGLLKIKPTAAIHVTCLYQLYPVATVTVEDTSRSHTIRIFIAIKKTRLQSIKWYQTCYKNGHTELMNRVLMQYIPEGDILQPQDIHITRWYNWITEQEQTKTLRTKSIQKPDGTYTNAWLPDNMRYPRSYYHILTIKIFQ